MTAFNQCFLFLDNPNGGVEDIAWLKQNCPWIKGVLCNVHAFEPEQWEAIVRPRALSYGLFCGPWGRPAKGDPNNPEFDPTIVDRVVATSDKWESPGLINPEKEIDGDQAALDYTVKKIGPRDFGLSVQPIPFADINWSVAAQLTVHPQIFPAEQQQNYDPIVIREMWWNYGVRCVYMTYGTYGGMKPSDFKLQAPYSLFTGDPVMASFTLPNWAPTFIGFAGCKPTTGGGMALTAEQVPYTGPYGLPTSKHRSKGPTAEALKRAMGHLKLLPWGDFNQDYDLLLWEAMADFKKSVGLAHDGTYGNKAWEKLRAATYRKDGKKLYAFDPYARRLIQNEAKITAVSRNEEKVQEALAEWGYAIIANEPSISYSQARPVKVDIDPNSKFSSDCSGTVIQGYAYAKRKTDLEVPDPAKQKWSGYGNTDWYEDDHPKVSAPYRIGDLAHFESSRHVIMCIKPGDYQTAEWVSHGWDGGPQLVVLSKYSRYPSEFLFVVRPPLLEV